MTSIDPQPINARRGGELFSVPRAREVAACRLVIASLSGAALTCGAVLAAYAGHTLLVKPVASTHADRRSLQGEGPHRSKRLAWRVARGRIELPTRGFSVLLCRSAGR